MLEPSVKISVILPIYNMEKYLRQCLESLFAQSLNEIEIICINDGSSDSSLDILKELATVDTRVIVIDQQKQGAAAARNTGIKFAKGKFLSILDADDFFCPNMLLSAYNKAEDTTADIVIFCCNFFDDDTNKYSNCGWSIKERYIPSTLFSSEEVSSYIFQFCIGWTWDKLFNREFVISHKLEFQNTSIHNDAFFVFTALLNAKRVAVMKDVLVTKRRNVETAISSLPSINAHWKDLFKFIYALDNYLRLNNEGVYWQSFLNLSLHLAIYDYNRVEGYSKEQMAIYMKNTFFKKYKFYDRSADYYYDIHEYNTMLTINSNSVVSPKFTKMIYYFRKYGLVATIKRIIKELITLIEKMKGNKSQRGTMV